MSYDDYDDILEDNFFLSEYPDVKKVALYIMDGSGNVEDVLIDLDDIKKYINKLYEKYPSAD